MAHSVAAMAAASTTTGEINYFFQDENGKILKVLKHTEIKKEPNDTSSVVYAAAGSMSHSNNNLGAYNQMNSTNQPQFVRLQSNYSIQPVEHTTYTLVPASSVSGNLQQQQQNQTHGVSNVKFEPTDEYVGTNTTVMNNTQRFAKYTAQSNTTTTKAKSKILNTQSSSSIPYTVHTSSVQKKRKTEKAGKGLRHFSMKVCEKVKEKGTTTYNEVADELVSEEIENNAFSAQNCDQKNIRRRVYDALNVLMAMQIISKDKKEIRWIGLPTNSIEQCSALERENEERRERIKQKHQQMRELLLTQVCFKSLIERNKEAERQGIVPTPNSSIQLPFIIVNTHKSTKINCSVTNDKSEYIFKFDDKFEMHDDAEVLKRMGLLCGLDKGQCSYADIERAKSLVPPNFEKYIEAYGNGKGIGYDSDDDMPSYIELTNESQSFVRGGESPDLDDDEEFLDHSDID